MVCMEKVYLKTVEMLYKFPQERMPMVCDRNKDVAECFLHVHNYCADRVPGYDEKLGPLTFDGKENCLPLQAADLLAYEIMKHADNRLLSNGKRRKSYDSLDKRNYLTFDYDDLSVAALRERTAQWALDSLPSSEPD